jgi:hypothetical protein
MFVERVLRDRQDLARFRDVSLAECRDDEDRRAARDPQCLIRRYPC